MNIHENTALLDAFLDGELSPDVMAEVQAHLDACPDCRAYVDDGLAIRAAFPTEEDVPLPADLKERVMAAVANAPQSHPAANQTWDERTAAVAASQPRKQPWGKLLAAAACLALIVLVQHGGLGMGTAANDAAVYAADSAVENGSVMERSVDAPETAMAQEADTDDAAAPESEGTDPMPTAFADEAVKEAELPVIRLTEADAGDLLADFTPEEAAPDCTRYLLTLEECEALAAQLAQRDVTLEVPADSEQLWLEILAE